MDIGIEIYQVHTPVYAGRAARTKAAMSALIHSAAVETRSFAEPKSLVDAPFPDSTIFEGNDRDGQEVGLYEGSTRLTNE